MAVEPLPPGPGKPQQGWGVVKFQSATIALLLLASVVVATSAHAQSSTIGRVWPIAEPDAMAEIEAKVRTLPPDMSAKFGPRSTWSAMKAAPLAQATRTLRRSVVPFYTLDSEIRLPDGTLLYPKGYTFNPLSYVTLPQRLVVVHPRDLAWALQEAKPADFILLTGNDGQGPDPLTLSERSGRALFILEQRVKERLGLTVAPVIVEQAGQKLELTEVRLDRPLARSAVGASPATPTRPRRQGQ
ncbi:MAG: conjugal transfer protein TraW [Sphingomonadales bacterium]|nr:conjugal transfer protein TraW [Sphingomonadales bacterium]MDE2170171.1 conjugal transfer protein TraW [Sphingomonadales bacterium]